MSIDFSDLIRIAKTRPYAPEPPSRSWTLFHRFDIRDADGTVYLRRWRIFECPWFGILLHQINGPDKDSDRHDHPWDFISIVLRGGYVEQVRPCRWGPRDHVSIREFSKWARTGEREVRWFNRKRATEPHRIVCLFRAPTWTLVLRGPRKRTWGFYTEDAWVPWHVYLGVATKDENVSAPRPRPGVVS